MNVGKNNLDANDDPDEGKVNENEMKMDTDPKINEEEAAFKTENASKRKITIEKGKKPIDFDDLFF